ncbi:substrate-binding domain-containing protein [Streptomyces sp. NPDC086787]|uniref:substrate-binding domain-containing protein n=1 Tax=Streptomyces sp. NPDC086787 TaxID=3365759 RepID=UPI003812993B
MRHIAMFVAASTMPLSLAGCGMLGGSGDSADASPTKGNDITVGLLMPETTNTRYAKFDYPMIKQTVADLTGKQGQVEYQNAGASASKQAEQMRKMVADKVDVILLDAVDSHVIADEVKKAKDAGIPVIAYDRLAEGPIDAYVSFDNELVGQVQARSVLEALGSDADSSDKVVMINGSPTDPNAKQFKTAAQAELTGKVTVAESYDTDGWKPKIAESNMEKAIAQIGKGNIAAVYSANDAMAAGVIKALKASGVTSLPPITGQDAELDAVQRIVDGEQYMTVYKSYPDEAEAAAKLAVAKVQGKDIQFEALTQDRVDSPSDKDIPAHLVTVSALTKSKQSIEDTVIADGIYRISDICSGRYKSDCAGIGLK